MKVKLLVNLKTANSTIIPAGTVFSDPIPEFVMKRLSRRQAEILDKQPVKKEVIPEPVKKEVIPEPVKKEVIPEPEPVVQEPVLSEPEPELVVLESVVKKIAKKIKKKAKN
jgi:hypothetical protein